MKKIVLMLVSVIGIAGIAGAQANGEDYNSAIGIRFGSTYYDVATFSYKNFVKPAGAIELNVGFGARSYGQGRTSTLSLALAYQHHFEIPVEGLKWYLGGGGTIFNTFSKYDNYQGFGLGIFPTGGLDYKFPSAPINLSFDLRPTFHIIGPSYYNAFYGNLGLAARYTFR